MRRGPQLRSELVAAIAPLEAGEAEQVALGTLAHVLDRCIAVAAATLNADALLLRFILQPLLLLLFQPLTLDFRGLSGGMPTPTRK